MLAFAAVLAQIAYPLVHGQSRDVLTVVTVALFSAAGVTHAGKRDGTVLLVVTAGIGFGVEVLGVHTGVPFGHYRYTHTLGAMVAGVPVVIAFAWTMLAWPALAVGRRIARTRVGVALIAGFALASWDVFLDPQMVHDHHWTWSGPGPRLNGIPLANHLGWLVVAIALCALLDAALSRPVSDEQPIALWLWTFGSSVLANLAFFDRPQVALAGGVAMGVVALPLVVVLRG
ncbi:MAG TPA: carotenoid biosynthesis protein [Mycobacteriales bacterium]|nr:carotenoid biosynthesis protein [Mycobacteriales bacterium]